MAGRVFISYASEDRDVADAVCAAIESRGMACWIAPRDITPGHDYAQALYDAIGECTALVLVFSEHANASPQVRREVERASRDGDPIFPFRIDDAVPAGGLEFLVGRVEWLAAPSVDLPVHIGILVEVVHAQLAGGRLRRPLPDPELRLTGSPAVVRRLTATWMTIFLGSALVLGFTDLIPNIDALANALYEQSIFEEEDVPPRVTALLGMQLIQFFPSAILWLVWLCAAFLTLEAAGIDRRGCPARRAPHRFLWPGGRFDGGASILAGLWDAAERSVSAAAFPSTAAPRWLWLLWCLVAIMLPLTLVGVFAADAEEWSDEAILFVAVAVDVVWIMAAVLGLRFLRSVEKRLRAREEDASVEPVDTRTAAAGGA